MTINHSNSASDRVLKFLRDNPNGDTGANIARTLGIPEPTMRRAIQCIRTRGYEVSYPPLSGGLYRLPTDSASDSATV